MIMLNSDQQRAIAQVLDTLSGCEGMATSLQGPAGTGKTTVLASLLPELCRNFEIILTGMTGKAALRASQLTGYDAVTLHKALYEPPDDSKQDVHFDSVRPPPKDRTLLVVDEASMMTPTIWSHLQVWLNSGCSVLLVGDGYQLPPVLSPDERRAFGESFSVFSYVPGASLETVMRSGDEVLKIATALRREQQLPAHVRLDRSCVAERHAETVRSGREAGLITWRNDTRMALNSLVRARLGYTGDTPVSGEPLLICRNGRDVLNGEVVITREMTVAKTLGPVQTHYLRAKDKQDSILVSLGGRNVFMDGWLPNLSTNDYNSYRSAYRRAGLKPPTPITWGHALTAHKAQGSEFDDVTVYLEKEDWQIPSFRESSMLPDGSSVPFWCRWIYTAMTRARHSVTLAMPDM